MQPDSDFACEPSYSTGDVSNADCSTCSGNSYPHSSSRVESTTSSQKSLDIRAQAVLRAETISRQSLKRYACCQFWVRLPVLACWITFSKLSVMDSFYRKNEALNLRLATGLSAFCLAVSIFALISFLWRVFKVLHAKQRWSQRRKRLTFVAILQLASLAIATLFFVAPSAYAVKRRCNSIDAFCRWSLFLQWTGWNTLLLTQLVLMHGTCAWTDQEGKPCRKLWMNFTPLTRNKPKNGLILDAPWSLHLPKLIIWVTIQATLITQLVVALQGRIDSPYAAELLCVRPLELCKYNLSNRVQFSIRCVCLGIWSIWYFVLMIQGITDMARMPFETFRMGRMLIRLVCSKDFGLASNILPAISLIWATLSTTCSSCQPNYILLGLLISSNVLISMSSWLLQPVSMSTDDDLLMSVWLQQFAWTEQSHKARIKKRNALPADETMLEGEPMFCFETAVKLLYWSGFVYDYDEGRENVVSETATQLYNLDHLELVRDPLTSTKCLVAWGQDTVVVAFRGTANKQNAVHDLQAWLVPHNAEGKAKVGYCGMGSAPAVHSGFSVSWQGALKKAVCSIVTDAAGTGKGGAGKMRLLVTGHSLGGVMAVLAAFDLADLCPWKSVQVYTYGAPRPGNKAFKEQYEAKLPDTWHVMNSQDPVPKMGKFGVLYARPGQRVILDPGGEMQVRPTHLDRRLASLNPYTILVDELPPVLRILSSVTFVKSVGTHYLTTYNQHFVQVIKGQLKKPRFEDGLEGVLHLANSVSLRDTLQAADLDAKVGQAQKLNPLTALDSMGGAVNDALSVV